MSFFSMSHSKREHGVSRGKHVFYEVLSFLCFMVTAAFVFAVIPLVYFGFPLWAVVSFVIAVGFGYGAFSICR